MAKTKYYLGDHLVRTSDRTYTHVVLSRNLIVAYCGRLDLAEKELNRRKNQMRGQIDFYWKCLHAKRAGKPFIMHTERCRNRSCTEKIKLDQSIEYYASKIVFYMDEMQTYHIEPLTAK